MNRNRIIGLIVLVLAVAGIIWGIYYSQHKNDNTSVNPDLSVSVFNVTQNVDGTQVEAHPKDQLTYTLTANNPTDDVISGYVMEVEIGNVTNAATLIDAQGANYNSGNNSLIWTPLDIPANGAIEKQFTVRVKDTLPADEQSRTLKVVFSNEVSTTLSAGTGSTGSIGNDGASFEAPKTGIPGWISFFLAGFITFGFLLFRVARKLGKPQIRN